MASILTNRRDVAFELCFKYKIEKGYKLTDLSDIDTKHLQTFLDKISKMTVNQVDALYARKPDHNDIYKGLQIYHYEVSKKFRINFVMEGGLYKIIRFDPNHSIHK